MSKFDDENVAGPEDLEGLKSKLIEAVIDAYMRTNKSAFGELGVADSGSCEEGRFYFEVVTSPRTGGTEEYYCEYPGGAWYEWGLIWDSGQNPGDEVGYDDAQLPDMKPIWEQISDDVSDWFDPFTKCESPHVFNNQVAQLLNVTQALYVQDEVRVGGDVLEPSDKEKEKTKGKLTIPTGDIQEAISDLEVYLNDVGGDAIDALQDRYTNEIALVLSGQRALATVAAMAIFGERRAWSRLFAELVAFYKGATADFKAVAEGGSATTSKELSILSGLATIAAGLTVPVPAVSGGLTAVAGITAVAANYAPAEREPSTVTLTGSDYKSLWKSFTQGVTTIDRDFCEAEYELGNMCKAVLEDSETYAKNFSITPPRRFLNDTSSELLNISYSKMKTVAGAIEAIGDHQRDVAKRLPFAQVKNEWYRGTLTGTGYVIGFLDHGHYADYEALVEKLIDILIADGKTAHRIAEHCIDAGNDFQWSDGDIEDELKKLENHADTVDTDKELEWQDD